MKILFLGNPNSPIIPFLESAGDSVAVFQEQLNATLAKSFCAEFIVSFGYRHIIRQDVIDLFPKKIINLHISFLPWNRGADPNFWSFLENTPKGVTIHYVDAGLDTGDILFQRELKFQPNDTLKTSYEKLQATMVQLFKENWNCIKTGTCEPKKQTTAGTSHRVKDKEKYAHLLAKLGHDTPIAEIETYLAKKK